jgi:hypothetical protein
MAVTVSAADVGDKPYYIVGSQKKTVKDVTLTGTYAAGGVAITAANLGLNSIDTASVEIQTQANAADILSNTQSQIASAGGTLTVELWDDTPAEVTATDTVTGTILRVTAFGS